MAKKEKKNKEKKKARKLARQAKKQAALLPEHQRPLICPPDRAGRGLGTRVFGYVCRCFVVLCLIWALMMFFGGAFTGAYGFWVGVSEFAMLGLALFATTVFALICYNRYTALGGLALGAAGIALLSPNVVQGVLALYNGFLCRLYLSKFTMYLTNLGIGVPNLTSGESLAGYYLEKLTAYGTDGMLVFAFLLAAVFVPLVAKRTRPVLPAITCLVIIVPVCVFNIASSGLGAGMLIASIAAVLVMWAYDKMFRRPADADRFDTKLQLFTEEGKPEYPEEYLQKKREKAEKKLQRKLAREQKKQKRKQGKTVDEEISSYFEAPKKKTKNRKHKMSEQEKAALKLEKQEKKFRKKEIRKQIRVVRRYEQVTDSAKSAMGGFAAAMMLAVCVIIIIIPALTIKDHLVIELLDEKISYARAYVTAALMGNDERLDELEYELDNDNFTPHSTELEHMTFDGTQMFFIESQYAANLYLKGWIGVDYRDGAWYTGQSTKDEENPGAFEAWRDLYGIGEYPAEQMFYDFYWLSHPDIEIFDPSYDFLTKYRKFTTGKDDLGFVATTVHMRRVNSYSSLLYLPSVYDQSRGLYGYGNVEKSEHSFVNYFDGVQTGRDFAESGTRYSAVTFAPLRTGKNWIDVLSADIANYNLQKELILAYNSYEIEELSYGTDVNTTYSVKVENDVPERGFTTVSYRRSGKVVASFIHENDCVNYSSQDKVIVLKDGAGNEYVLELDSNYKVKNVSTENTESLLYRYISGADDDRRKIDRILLGGDLDDQEDDTNYTDYVYTYYTGKSNSAIIAELAQKIRNEATYKEKVPTGEFIHHEAVTHEEFVPIGTELDIDFVNNVYYTKETVTDENGVQSETYVVCEGANESMMAELYEKIVVVDEEAYDEEIFEIVEHPYDFTSAAMPGATFDAATVQRNDLVKAVIDYIIEDMGCEYTLTPDLELVNADLDGVENFLTNTKEGYCVQFASAVALILREYGIPTRYVEGYIACDFNVNHDKGKVGRFFTYVHDYEAHAWIEVFFDGIGWVQYECTPAYYAGLYGGADSNESEDSSSSTPPPSFKEEIEDILNTETDEEETDGEEMDEEEQQRRSLIIASVVFISVAVVLGGIIWLLTWLRNRAASAEYKKNSAVDTVLAEHFGQNTSEDDRRELSYTVIDALHNVLDIYGLSPEPGEFKDEYARRLAVELEDVLGRSPEYESESTEGAEDAETDPNVSAKEEIPVSPHRMGQIMDAISAEEFGHGMSIAQMKQVSALYKDLRANVHKRVPFGRRMILRYFKNRL